MATREPPDEAPDAGRARSPDGRPDVREVAPPPGRTEADLRRVLDHVPDGVVILHDSAFVYANPAAARILGYESPADLLGVHFHAIVRPEELPTSVDRVRRMSGDAPPPRNVRPMVRRDGSMVYAETLGFQIEYGGRPSTLVIAHDITIEREVEAQILQADRLASLGLLAAGVAHELNNPLAYVLLNLVQVQKRLREVLDGAPTDRLADAVQMVEHSLEGATRMRSIVGDLRAFSRTDDRRSVLLDVGAVIDSVLSMADRHLRDRARLVRRYEAVPAVRANEARLGQVFLNLLVNAAQAIPEDRGGTIEVVVRPEGTDRVAVEIRDTGIGMAPDVLARAFEPFFTTKSPDIGTGLGLSVCLGILQGLDGTLSADSEPGLGSRFVVTLPTASSDEETSEPLRAPMPTERARVLVVDDEPRVARGLAATLDGHDVIVVTGGQEAIDRLREEHFDVVFCDLMMPGVTGIDVFEHVQKSDAPLAARFIFMTAGAYTPQARAFLDHVPNPRLDKPFDAAQVTQLFRLVVAGSSST